jgi:hypothetical protein
MAQAVEVRLDLGAHVRRKAPTQVRAQKRVLLVLVAEPWWILKELSHRAVVPRSPENLAREAS